MHDIGREIDQRALGRQHFLTISDLDAKRSLEDEIALLVRVRMGLGTAAGFFERKTDLNALALNHNGGRVRVALHAFYCSRLDLLHRRELINKLIVLAGFS